MGLISLGCPKNTVDSERLLGELERRGWEFTADMLEADCLVVNTCGFIDDARLESVEAIGEICEAREANPDVILVATGCLPQRIPGELRELFPQLDLVAGVGSLGELPDLIEKLMSRDKRPSADIPPGMDAPGRALLSETDDPRLRLTSPWTAYMKIAEGCDHSCAFCTIPSIKGGHFSRTVDDLVREAKALAADGVREIIIVSQDTTAYGSDIGTSLRVLLQELDKVDGLEWIRLHYLYPGKVSSGLLNTIAESRHIIPYFDIPLQHISQNILHRMDRLAPDTDPLDLIGKIRARFDVLPEGESDDGRLVGRSYRDAPEIDGLIFVSGVPETVPYGEIIEATVTGALPYDLEAVFVPGEDSSSQ